MKTMPPLIVIGLTGPFCSGCSTLARFFADPDEVDKEHGNKLLKKLIKRGLVLQDSEGLEVNWKNVNKIISDKLEQYEQIKSSNKEGKILGKQNNFEEEKKRIFKELGRLLEQRESLKTLPFLAPYFPIGEPHLFRTLLMSDIIVFRSLVEISQGKSSEYKEEFDPLGKDAIQKIEKEFSSEAEIQNLKINTISDFYNEISKRDPNGNLIRSFTVIHREVRKLKEKLMETTKGKETEILQKFGNNIRKCGDPFGQGIDRPSQNCVRLAQDMEKVVDMIYNSGEAAFFVVDCLRNPNEVLYFRQRFPLFYFVSIYADKENRLQRRLKDLMIKNANNTNIEEAKKEFNKVDELDSGSKSRTEEEKIYNQDVTKCVQLSDYSINNLEDLTDEEDFLYDKLLRLVSLILCPGSSKPRKEEVYMNMAYAMAVKSNCICRQVGAVIAGEDDYIIGAGWNDVARGEISCGLREVYDMNQKIHEPLYDKVKTQIDNYMKQHCFCFKDMMAKIEVGKKLDKALQCTESPEFKHLKDEHKKNIADLVEKANLHQLEFCLALHAEENAIIQGSRIGGQGIRGSTIYTTLQPCTLCAKKIKQSGIKKVIYTDPYPKSEPSIFMNGIDLEQFEGVKPRAYIRLFMPNLDKKECQGLEIGNIVPGFDFKSGTYLFELG